MKAFAIPIFAALLGVALLVIGPMLAVSPEVGVTALVAAGGVAYILAGPDRNTGLFAQLGEVTELKPEDLRKAVLEALGTHTKELSDKIAKADAELKTYGATTEETRKAIADLGTKGVDIEKRVADELKKISDLELRLAEAEKKIVAGDKPQKRSAGNKSVGQRFIEAQETKSFRERFVIPGQNGSFELRRMKAMSDPVVIGSLWEQRDITSLDSSAGDAIWSQRQPEIISEPYRPLSIRNLIPSIPVTSNLIEYVKTLARTSAVDYVSEGATKPKSNLTFDRVSTPIRKIAHYIKASMEVLADFPRLKSIIDFELMAMLKIFEEDELLLGDGLGDSIEGLIPQATAYETARNRTGDTRLDVIRHAILQVTLSYYSPTGIVLNPEDWEKVELTKDGDGRYIVASATATTGARLWGLPVVQSHAMPVSQFMVGAFASAAEIYDRMTAAIFVSTENEDDFIKNMVSILAEERLGLAVKRPPAFVHGDFDDAQLSTGV